MTDTAFAMVVIAATTLLFNVCLHLFGGGWKLSSRISSIEVNVVAVQAEIKKLSDVLIKLADMRGEVRVLDTRMTAAEQDIRELRHGQGFVQGPRGLDREYP